jgi:CheY-like chemotaxis protein
MAGSSHSPSRGPTGRAPAISASFRAEVDGPAAGNATLASTLHSPIAGEADDVGQARSDHRDRVLVVEDDPDARRALERSLKRLGYDVTTADDGEAGLKLAIQDEPQVIFSDIRMPKMDGHTLLRRLASHDLDAAVIVMSAQGDMHDVIDVLRNGAVDYLEKPFASSELVAAVGRAVAIHEQRRRARLVVGGVGELPGHDPSIASGERPTPAADPVFTTILEEVRRGEIVLPPVPAVIAELLARLGARDSSMADIAAIVERDPRLAAQVLRITNTPQYARLGRVSDLLTAGRADWPATDAEHRSDRALARPSTGEGPRHPRAAGSGLALLRRSSGRDARPGGARRGPAGFGDRLPCRLLADSGASFLLWVSSERTANEFATGGIDSHALGLREQHQEVGAALLAHWNLDPVIALVARTHHLEAPPAPQSGYWSLAVLAAAMADELSGGDDPTRSSPPSPALIDRSRGELRIGVSGISRIAESVRREFEGVMEMLA